MFCIDSQDLQEYNRSNAAFKKKSIILIKFTGYMFNIYNIQILTELIYL